MNEYNIIVCGVGGQGVVTIANVLGLAAFKQGIKSRVGEIHGLSQRFGSVFSYVRFGEDVYSAIVPVGKGDLILSLEPSETLRHLKYLRIGGTVIMNRDPVPPVQVSMGVAKYPSFEEIESFITNRFRSKLIAINARALADRAGNPITLNSVMIGAAVKAEGFPISEDKVKEALIEVLGKRYLDENLKAFELGKAAISSSML